MTHSDKAALRGEPSYVWRAGQQRRLDMLLAATEGRERGVVLVDGCGVGSYLSRLAPLARKAVGLDIEYERTIEARHITLEGKGLVLCGAGEALPFADNTFDMILSHEVLEHVQDDLAAIREIVRTLKVGGRLLIFVPNRGYPFETHGIYWRGKYHFGNIPLVNWLPRRWRDRLAPHVDVYTRRDLEALFAGLPVKYVRRTILFGAYDNIIARTGVVGKTLRAVLQALEKTPLRIFGLSHFWVVEKV